MPLRAGQALGHYRILRPLGAGGMGEVYEAEDAKLGRRVALKILPEGTASQPQRRERFEREARAIAALNHPSIVTLYSVENVDGVDFITMELVEGQTLRRVIPRGGLSLDRLLEVALPLAEALAAAHQQGITHRDLKPENVLVGSDGKVKVLDFGLAKVGSALADASGGSMAPTRALTEEGKIVGTVAYMSPEQAEGKPVDPRSDVFTLGIILFEMSTGERPFKGDTAVSVLSSILKDNPPPVNQINASLPRDLARIVNRCLMKDPARRFQSARGLSVELAQLKLDSDSGELESAVVDVARPAKRSPADGAAPRRPGRLLYGGLTAAVAAAAAAGYLAVRGWHGGGPATGAPTEQSSSEPAGRSAGAGAPSAPARQRIVVLPFENLGAPADAYFADGVTEEITSRLASVSGLGVISRTSAVQYAKTGKTTRQIGAELGVEYVLEGTVRWERGSSKTSRVRVTPQLVRVADDTQLWGDHYDRQMKDIFTVQSEIAEQVVDKLGLAMRQPAGGQPAASQPTQNLDAYQLFLRGKALSAAPDQTIQQLSQGVVLLEQALRLDPKFAPAWAALSYSHSSAYHNRWDFTEERLAKAREDADKALALQPGLREGHLALGYYFYWGRRDYGQARQEFLVAAGPRGEDPDALAAMAYVMRREGRWNESIAAMERAFALSPRDVDLISSMSQTYQQMRRLPEALRYADLALSLAPDLPGLYLTKVFIQIDVDGNTRGAWKTLESIDPRTFPDHPGVESLLYFYDGRFKESLEKLDAEPKDVIDAQTIYQPKPLLVGLTYLAMNDAARARPACESARQILEKAIARDPGDPRKRAAQGLALACLGRKDEAVREAKLATDMSPLSKDALDGAGFLQNLADVYALVGDKDDAFDILERLLATPSSLSVSILRIDPLFAPLRSDPRFRKMIERPT